MRLIDADALLRRVERWRDRIVDTYGKNDEYANCLAEVVMKIEDAPTAEPRWIPVTERLPECEQEVLICTEKKQRGGNAYINTIITPAIYEDGTMRENDSTWRWEDIDYAGWDEEEDCGIVPEGWWENRHFNPDDVYNNPVDQKVVAWMPLPEPWKGEDDGENDSN